MKSKAGSVDVPQQEHREKDSGGKKNNRASKRCGTRWNTLTHKWRDPRREDGPRTTWKDDGQGVSNVNLKLHFQEAQNPGEIWVYEKKAEEAGVAGKHEV